MRFFKYEGLGNDFILIHSEPCLSTSQVTALCDRHTGIGADGILFVFQNQLGWHMKVLNQDGSIGPMCGNGIRCVAQFLKDLGNNVKIIHTDCGPKSCQLVESDWSIDMGLAEVSGNRVAIGNHHLVLEGAVQQNLIDPTVNTEFFKLLNSNEVEVTVFEAGAGETQACGTGACAVTAFLVKQNRLSADTEIKVHLKGGTLYIRTHPTREGLQVQMKGPAKKVFEGEV